MTGSFLSENKKAVCSGCGLEVMQPDRFASSFVLFAVPVRCQSSDNAFGDTSQLGQGVFLSAVIKL